jgi:hypothetical protein
MNNTINTEEILKEKNSLKNKKIKDEILKKLNIRTLNIEEAKLLKHSIINIIKKRTFSFVTFKICASQKSIENPDKFNTKSLYLNIFKLNINKNINNNEIFLLNDEPISDNTLLNIILEDLLICKNKIIVNYKQLSFYDILNSEFVSYGIETHLINDYFDFKNSMLEFSQK